MYKIRTYEFAQRVPNTYLRIVPIWRESLGFPPIVGLRIP